MERSKYLIAEDIDTLGLYKKEEAHFDEDLEAEFRYIVYWFDLHSYIRINHISIYNEVTKKWSYPWISIHNINVCGFPGNKHYYGQCKNLKELKFLIKRIVGEHSYKGLKKMHKWD